MEKPRMANRFRKQSGLLRTAIRGTMLCFALLSATVYAESGPDEPLSVILSRSPDQPIVGGLLSITLLVDHPRPADVEVTPPPFPGGLALTRTKKEPKSLPGGGPTGKRWTSVEYEFTVASSGEYRIGPFVVQAAGKSASTAPMAVAVSAAAPVRAQRTLAWTGTPEKAPIGEPFELSLIVSGGPAPDAARPVVAIPENAIFGSLPVSDADLREGKVARFRVTLLDGPALHIAPATLRLPDGSMLKTAALSVPASALRVPAEAPKKSAGPTERRAAVKAAGVTEVAFPESRQPRLLRSWLERLYAPAREHWDRRDYVAALAVLRAAERDAALGFEVREVRKKAETALGLFPSLEEPYAPFLPLLSLALISAAVAALFGVPLLARILRRDFVTSVFRRRFIVVLVAVSIFGLAVGRLLFAAVGAREGVILSSCRAFRVPDPAAAGSADFAEGQAGRARASTGEGDGSWLYVELEDGRSGWIEAVHARRY